MASPDEVTRLLQASRTTGAGAVEELMRLIYDDLRAYARAALGRGGAHSVDPTGLVHEAYVKLVHQESATYQDRRHFFAVAAQAVRRILVDHARWEGAQKRGGGDAGTRVDTRDLLQETTSVDVLDLHEAMEALAAEEPRAARLVELRFFGGLTGAEAAEQLGISASTASLDWRYARAWLYRRLGGR